jgi:hypothetical protein
MKLVGERRALAALMLAFWFINFLMNALMGGGPMVRIMYALAGVYGLAFFGVVAGYFWARWYAIGVSLFGVILGVVGLWQAGPDEGVLIFGGTHLLVTLGLVGTAMSQLFDGQAAWRERFHMDDNAVQRLGRSVIRAGASLPLVLAYGLMPRQGGAALAMVALATLGFAALVRLRTWGVLALGAAGALALTAAPDIAFQFHGDTFTVPSFLTGALLLTAAAPFAAPMLRVLRGRV